MKIGIVFDSSCGFTKKEVEAKGAFFAPLIITINNQDFEDGINITGEELEKHLVEGAKVQTAAAPLGALNEAFTAALKEHDHVVYISLSKHLSSSNANALMVSKEPEFQGKVTVYDSEMITPWLFLNVEAILNKAKEGNLDALVTLLNKIQRDVIGMVSPETLLYLKNGGRISNAEYIAGSLLKVKPIVIAYKGAISEEKHGLKLSKAKGKGIDKLINKMFDVFEDNQNVLEHGAAYEPFIISKGEFEREFFKEASEKFEKMGYSVDSIRSTSFLGSFITSV